MANRKKKSTPGAQLHAEGQHGTQTHKRFIEILHERAPQEGDEIIHRGPVEGRHRLDEEREQHDEAEKGSEKVKFPHEGDSL